MAMGWPSLKHRCHHLFYYDFGMTIIRPDILGAGIEKILIFLDAGQVEESNHDVPYNQGDNGDDSGDVGIKAMLVKKDGPTTMFLSH